jgi:hypothetical protein
LRAKKDKKGKETLRVSLPLFALLVLFCFSQSLPNCTPTGEGIDPGLKETAMAEEAITTYPALI